MKTIWKYEIKLKDFQQIKMPYGAIFLHADYQGEKLCLWFEVETKTNKKQLKNIWIVGTGNPKSNEANHHYTSVQKNGFVWHIYGCY